MKIDIITKEEIKNGEAYRVKRDIVIDVIVRIKKLLGKYQGNELYVSKNSLEQYRKMRKDFETSIFMVTVFAAVFMVLFLITGLNNIQQALFSLIGAIILGTMLIVLVILTKYVPAIEETPVMIGEEGGKENNNQG
ncbi:MAG: hypothetical protein NZ908_00605 [Candidatus Micrarchaeota archaeon]|nr:hypothetical protein [Candidatus Micrarchaeota archaeon]MCX8154463.1 hypothetical protein [Candidatus Micrarchaeota archaeon]